MSVRWLALPVVLVVVAAALLLLPPLGPVLREARESSALLDRLIAQRRLESALAKLAGRMTANAWSWPQAPAATAWQRCRDHWPCPPAAEELWVLRPAGEEDEGIEEAVLFRYLGPSPPATLAEAELRVRAAAGERALRLLGWRPPDLSRVGGGWLERRSLAARAAGEPGGDCDLSARLLGHRPGRAECDSSPPSEDEAWLRRLAETIPKEALCAPGSVPGGPLVRVEAGATWACGRALAIGTLEAPALVVVDLPARIEADSALEVVGVLHLRPSANPEEVLGVEGRLSVRGLLAVEGGVDLEGEFRLEPDPEVLARLSSRTLWRTLRGIRREEGVDGD